MNRRAVRTFLVKEILENFRTYRFYVLAAALIFFGLTSPIIAKLTPELIESALPGGLEIKIPDPVYKDAYLNFLKNLNQLGLIVLILVSMGLVAEEKARGTAVLVLIRPLSRSAFIWIKYLVLIGITAICTAVATVGAYLYTLALFEGVQLAGFPLSIVAWFLFACMIVAATTLFSVVMPNQMSAAGMAFLVYIVFYAAPALGRGLEKYSPGVLLTKGGEVAAGLSAEVLFWPAMTAAALTLFFLWLAAALFNRQEL